MSKLKYKRILIKLSGESLAGEAGTGIDIEATSRICKSIKELHDKGAEIAIVVGGGNFWRGRSGGSMDRIRSDHIGMLATVMNALALCDALEQLGVDARVQTAITMQAIAEPTIRNKALRHLDKGRIVIYGCGTGHPFFSTDTASTLRAAEIGADVIFKATMVDGIYDKDPHKFVDAIRFEAITFKEILAKSLEVMDSTAASMSIDNNIPILVFSIEDPHNIVRAAEGQDIGTIVSVD